MQKIKENKNVIIIGLTILLLVPLGLTLSSNEESTESEQIETIEKTEGQETVEEQKPAKLKIDIKGEVNKPGVYELKENDRVSDAIKKADGLTENADTTLINLSKNLKDEMVIIIYNKYEIEKLKEQSKETKTIIEYVEKECSCPDTINDACIKKSESKETKKEENQTPNNNKISINNGTLEELITIPGIGESKAKSIIKYREENGKFNTIEELKNISGIGESTFEKLKEYITV